MHQNFIHGLPLPVTLALIVMLFVLLALAWALAPMGKPAPVRRPPQDAERGTDYPAQA
jgi:hypothetical protein